MPLVLSDQTINLDIQLRLQWNIDSTKGLVKRVRFSKIPRRSSTPICSLIREAKLFIKRHICLNVKAMDAVCLKAKAALILPLSGYKIVTIQMECYFEV